MDTELKMQLNQLLSQCNEDNIEEFENTVEEESQENQDIEFANDPMKQLEAIIKKEPMDKDDDYYYVLVIDNPKDKENVDDTNMDPKAKVKHELEGNLEPMDNRIVGHTIVIGNQEIQQHQNEQEQSEVELETEMDQTNQQNHSDFEHSMDSFLISNNAISANVPATILENEEYQDENDDVTIYESNQDMDALTDNGIQITDEQNLIKILTSQEFTKDGSGTIFLKSHDGINYIADGELVTNEDDQDGDAPEVIYYEGDNESQFQIVKYDGSELVIEYADDSNQVTPSFICECGEQFTDYNDYVKHQHKHNPAGEHLCNLCGKGFESAEILTGHMVLHNVSGLLLQCPFCEAVMKRSVLTQHIKYSHNNIKPQCHVCEKTFANPNNLKRHMMIHSGVKEFECDLCLKRFSQKITMQTHRLTHINPQQPTLTCPGCENTFKTKEILTQHIENGECPKSKVIDSEAKEELMKAVKKEVKTSLGKLLGYACSLCKRMFSIESALERHIESTHIIDPSKLLCSECGEVVSSKKEMAAHILAHDKRKIIVKRFECSICGKGCSSQAMLLMHERVHTNERPYSCQLCPLKFKTKTHLRTHQLTHTREKKFGCSVCMKFFALKGNLVVHLRTHTGERPYVCSDCGDAFIDSKYLKKHKLKKHATDNVPWNQFLKVKYEEIDEEA